MAQIVMRIPIVHQANVLMDIVPKQKLSYIIMGQIISGLYLYIKSIFPPCIENYTTEYIPNDISSNNVTSYVYSSDISSNLLMSYDISSNAVASNVASTVHSSALKESLDTILKNKYHIPHKKAVFLMEEFHTLHAILSLSETQLAETKCNGRKLGSLGHIIWKQLHSV